MPPGPNLPATYAVLVLLMLAALVHVAGSTTVGAQAPKSTPVTPPPPSPTGRATSPPTPRAGIEVRHGTDSLPIPVLEMREAILAAVRTGKIEEIRTPIEMNEIKPNFGDGPVPDPVEYLKKASSDGQGQEILTALGAMLEGNYAVVPLGRDIENNRIYVWPAFAETGLSGLRPEQEAQLRRLVPEPLAKEMLDKGGTYSYWRVGIAADGTWHVFSK